MAKRDIQSQINEVLEVWDCEQQEKFLRDVIPLLDLYYNIGKDMHLFQKEESGIADAATVRLIRSVYILSIIAERHSAKFATIKMLAPRLWMQMEKENESE